MTKYTLKTIDAKSLDQMSSDELREMLAQCRTTQMSIEGRNKSPLAIPLPHPSGEARQNRKTIARIMTILVRRKERCV